MKNNIRMVIFLVAIALMCTPIFAQNETRISFTPRVWFASIDLPVEDLTSTENFSLPMYGGTVTISPASTPNFSFLVTGLWGEGDGEAMRFGGLTGELEADRLDIEGLVRYNIPNKSLAIYAGLRYIGFKQEIMIPDWEFTAKTDHYFWIPEVGLGTAVNITENGRHRFFTNATVGFGLNNWDYMDTDGYESSGDVALTPTIDFNAGYQYAFSENFSFNGRYRLFTTIADVELTDGIEQNKLVTIHGPEIGLTVTF